MERIQSKPLSHTLFAVGGACGITSLALTIVGKLRNLPAWTGKVSDGTGVAAPLLLLGGYLTHKTSAQGGLVNGGPIPYSTDGLSEDLPTCKEQLRLLRIRNEHGARQRLAVWVWHLEGRGELTEDLGKDIIALHSWGKLHKQSFPEQLAAMKQLFKVEDFASGQQKAAADLGFERRGA